MKIKVVREKIKRTYRKNDITIVVKHKDEFTTQATSLVEAIKEALLEGVDEALNELQEEEI